jgi:hypothetical protein
MASDDYTTDDIKQYMRNRLASTDAEDSLFEFTFQQNCRDALADEGLDPASGRGLLLTFTAIASGWQVSAGRQLVGSSPGALDLPDDFDRITAADLDPVQVEGDGGHPHPHANGAHPEYALNSLSELTVSEESVGSLRETFERLEATPNPFDRAMSSFTDVRTFGGLSAFDFLDVAVRVNSRTMITPDKIHAAHVDRNGPQVTLERTLANEVSDGAPVQSGAGQSLLDELVNFAKDELGLSHTDAIFDVESCLCTYHGELADEGPDWRDNCT